MGLRYRMTVLRLTALCAFAALVGCADHTRAGRPACGTCEEPDRFVRIQPAPLAELRVDQRGLAHPLHLSEREWETLLHTIQVQRLHRPLLSPATKGAAEATFTDEEVRYLGEALSRACAEAGPDEWVVFALRRMSGNGLTEMTSGAWYATEARVHLRLANYRVAVTLPGLRTLMWEHPTRPQGEVFYEVVTDEHHVLVTEARMDPFGSSPADLAIDYAALTKTNAVSNARGSLEERLKTLKRWRDQGLITEEDYRAKKQRMLDEL